MLLGLLLWMLLWLLGLGGVLLWMLLGMLWLLLGLLRKRGSESNLKCVLPTCSTGKIRMTEHVPIHPCFIRGARSMTREAFRHLVNAVDYLLVELRERGTK